jgi:hypothetical protein
MDLLCADPLWSTPGFVIPLNELLMFITRGLGVIRRNNPASFIRLSNCLTCPMGRSMSKGRNRASTFL